MCVVKRKGDKKGKTKRERKRDRDLDREMERVKRWSIGRIERYIWRERDI